MKANRSGLGGRTLAVLSAFCVLLALVGCTKTSSNSDDGNEAGAGATVGTDEGWEGGAGGKAGAGGLGCSPIDVEPIGSDDGTVTSGETKCYSFTVEDNGILTLTLTGANIDLRADVYPEPEGSALVGSILGTVGATSAGNSKKIPLPPGTYYIKVWNGTGVYKLETSFDAFGIPFPDPEPGSDIQHASDLTGLTASSTEEVGGYVGTDLNPIDIYSFTVEDNGILTLTLTGANIDLRADVYPEPEGGSALVGSILGTVGATSAGNSKPVTLAPGTYFIKVWNGTGLYRLETSFAATQAN